MRPPKIGDRVRAMGTVVNAETFELVPTDQIYTVVGIGYVHPRWVAEGRGRYAIYIQIDGRIHPFFFDQFEIVKTVGFIIE